MRPRPTAPHPGHPHRLVVLAAAVLIHLCLGGIYGWSVLARALNRTYGFSAGELGLVFGLCVLAFTAAMIPAGRLLRRSRVQPRTLSWMGALLIAAGYTTAALSPGSFGGLLLGLGFLAGTGIGCCYLAAMVAGVQPFAQKGLPTGLIVAGFAAGSIFQTLILESLLARAYPIDGVILSMGALLGATLWLSSLAFNTRETEDSIERRPSIDSHNESGSKAGVGYLAASMFFATFGGLLIISNLNVICDATPWGASLPLAVALFSLGNAGGRLSWGAIRDRFRKQDCISHAITIMVLTMLVLSAWMDSRAVFYGSVLLAGATFGAFFVLFPTEAITRFGNSQFPDIYPLVFLAYGMAAAISATCGGMLFDAMGSITWVMVFGIGFEGLGLLMMYQFRKGDSASLATSKTCA